MILKDQDVKSIDGNVYNVMLFQHRTECEIVVREGTELFDKQRLIMFTKSEVLRKFADVKRHIKQNKDLVNIF